MERTKIGEIKPGTKVKIQGWIKNLRDKRTMQFLVIKDITGEIQVTIEKEKIPEIASLVSASTLSSVVEIEGEVFASEFVKLNGMELIPSSYKMLSHAEALPINDESNLDARLNYRWIDLRDDKNTLIFKIETLFEHSLREYEINHNGIEIHTPKITAQSSEGGSEVFKLDYFGQPAYLTQSPQLYKQMSMASGFEKTYEIGDYYRAESSFTSRHATEFVGFDLEMSYINSHLDVMREQENLMKYAMKKVNEVYGEQIKSVFGTELVNTEIDFPVLSFKNALEILEKEYNYKLTDDLDPDAEKFLGDYAKEKFGSDFIFITEYPFKSRAFYSMKAEDEKYTKSYDLLFRGQEITSGAQREHRPDVLRKQIAEKGINPENMKDYIQFFEYGCPPHGGFGMGLARVMARMLNLATIKDATFIFRGPTRLNP